MSLELEGRKTLCLQLVLEDSVSSAWDLLPFCTPLWPTRLKLPLSLGEFSSLTASHCVGHPRVYAAVSGTSQESTATAAFHKAALVCTEPEQVSSKTA